MHAKLTPGFRISFNGLYIWLRGKSFSQTSFSLSSVSILLYLAINLCLVSNTSDPFRSKLDNSFFISKKGVGPYVVLGKVRWCRYSTGWAPALKGSECRHLLANTSRKPSSRPHLIIIASSRHRCRLLPEGVKGIDLRVSCPRHSRQPVVERTDVPRSALLLE